MRRGVLAIVAVGVLVALAVPPAGAATVPGTGCPMFPADSWWHRDISALPVHPLSDAYVASMGAGSHVHADFGAGLWDGGPIGIPYVVVGSGTAAVPVTFDYDDESDHGTYRVPPGAPIEGGPSSGGDRHVLIVDRDSCQLAELYAAYPDGNGGWHAGSGAIWDLGSNALRPDSWTSADAAGLPILPGLVRRDEVAAGYIDHAIRVTARRTAPAHVWPARHDAGSDGAAPPMGLRLRLKADVDISSFPRDDQVILTAMRTYGLVVADNGSSWYVSGVPDEGWDNDVLHALGSLSGASFEAVDASSLMVSPDSGQAAGGSGAPAGPPAGPTPDDGGAPAAAPGGRGGGGLAGSAGAGAGAGAGATGPDAEAPTTDTTATTAAPSTTAPATTAPPTTGTDRAAAAVTESGRPGHGRGAWPVVAVLVLLAAGAATAWARRRGAPEPPPA